MKVSLKRLNEDVLFEAKNENGNTILIDGKPVIGGRDAGFRPMELLLAAIGGCSVMDIISILKKQRQDVKNVLIDVNGDREDEGEVSIYKKIHLHYTLEHSAEGSIDEKKAERAIELGVHKYCSVGKMLEKDAEISYSFSVRKVEK
jgi:putative redox protein